MSRRITILAIGSRGDVQPFIALGLGLQRAGYTVCIAAAADYAELVETYGLAFHPLVGRISTLLDPAGVEQFLAHADHPVWAGRHFVRQVNPIVAQLMRDCRIACQDAHALIVSTLGMYCGLHLAEKLQIPWIVAHLHPYGPTGAAPHMFFPSLPLDTPLGSVYNRWTHSLADTVLWQVLRRPFNRSRHRLLDLQPLGPLALLQRLRRFAPPTLYGYSASVAPPPADWSNGGPITGYWFLAANGWQPPAALAAFLAAGPPPVYLGFGSMMLGRDGDRITQLVVDALQQVGERGILYRGWGELGRMALPPAVLAVDAVPHDWLFKRVQAVVHHGGAGVTAAALRAGVPAVVVPFLGDQHFWAKRVCDLGAGPTPIWADELSAERLAQALATAVHSTTMRDRAAALGQQLKAERGVHKAVAWIDAYLHNVSCNSSIDDGSHYGSTITS